MFNSPFVSFCHNLAVLPGCLKPQEVFGWFHLFVLLGQERNTKWDTAAHLLYCIFFWISWFSSSSLKCFNEGRHNKSHGLSFIKITNKNVGKYEIHYAKPYCFETLSLPLSILYNFFLLLFSFCLVAESPVIAKSQCSVKLKEKVL